MTTKQAADIIRMLLGFLKGEIEPPKQETIEEARAFEQQGYECLEMAIKTLERQEKMDWIPINEGLPELYEEVIVTDIETIDTYVSRYIGNGYWECDNGPFNNRIIAWQSKPKPYKAESEDKE